MKQKTEEIKRFELYKRLITVRKIGLLDIRNLMDKKNKLAKQIRDKRNELKHMDNYLMAEKI